jgi:hypothetical protein
MAMTILPRDDPRFPKGGPDPENDQLSRQQRAHAAKKDEREKFTSETVSIAVGPKATKMDVVLCWPSSARIVEEADPEDELGNVRRSRIWTGGKYIFAVYANNLPWHAADRAEWEAGARNAIEKFAAIRGLTITSGPRQEDTNRYNIMAETREEIRDH